MRILVISDSHKNGRSVDEIIARQPYAEHVFFLGDLTADIMVVVRRNALSRFAKPILSALRN